MTFIWCISCTDRCEWNQDNFYMWPKDFGIRGISMAIRVRWTPPPHLVFRPLPICTVFGEGHIPRLSEECPHQTWPRPCSGGGRLLRTGGTQWGFSLMPREQSSSPPSLSFFLLAQYKMLFGQTNRPWLLLPQYPMDSVWHSKLKQWLL